MSLLRTFIFVIMVAVLGFIHEAKAEARYGWIGAQVRPMTRAVAISLGMAVPHGAIFEQPLADGPAAGSRIHAGDVVTRINGTPLENSDNFEPQILGMAPGTRIHLRVFRNRQPMTFTIPLGSTKCPRQP